MRRLLIGLAALAIASAPLGVGAQAAGKVYRLGLLVMSVTGPGGTALRKGLSRELAQRGFVPGRNLAIEIRGADGKPERLPALAKQLVDDRVDVIVTASYPAARAAKEATTTVPIVILNGGDPVETHLAASLSRPGGNLTGISDMSAELSVKRLELLKDAVPGLKKVAVLWNADDLTMTARYHAITAAASNLGIAVQPLGVREPDDFDGAFAAMARDKPDGFLMVTDVLTLLNHKRVIQFAAAHRIPAIYEFEGLVSDGGLMSYGPAGKEKVAGVADLVARILKGAKPADLPLEQPTRFSLAVNQRVARQIGVTLPRVLLLQADEIID